MARRRIPDTLLTYVGQVATGGAVPQRFLHADPGHKRILLSDERQNTYVYDAPRTIPRAQVESWASTAFPFGCSIAVVQPPITRGRKK